MSINKQHIQELTDRAKEARHILIKVACASGSAHIGSSLSEIEILEALYGDILHITPKTADDPNRDRFILSKGHAGLGLYVVLAQYGFIPSEELDRYGQNGSKLAVHPVYASAPGIEATTGSLGHGLPMGVGLAIASKRDKKPWRSFVLMSDGECDEGSNWEAILLAGHLNLDNLVAIVDYNKIQSFGTTKEVLDLEPFADKWRAARWAVQEIDGHSFEEILNVFSTVPFEKGKPTVVIAHTVKGKGIPFMEDKLEWHYLNVKPEALDETLEQIY